MGKEYIAEGGPCVRQCNVDMKTLVCKICGLSFKEVEK